MFGRVAVYLVAQAFTPVEICGIRNLTRLGWAGFRLRRQLIGVGFRLIAHSSNLPQIPDFANQIWKL